jgi:hypothetical protein
MKSIDNEENYSMLQVIRRHHTRYAEAVLTMFRQQSPVSIARFSQPTTTMPSSEVWKSSGGL